MKDNPEPPRPSPSSPITKNKNFTMIPDRILDHLPKMQLTGHENRIIQAIWRKTYGWQKPNGDFISPSQFQTMTGLSKCEISETVLRLIKRNIITKNTSYRKPVYKFNDNPKKWTELSNQKSQQNQRIQKATCQKRQE